MKSEPVLYHGHLSGSANFEGALPPDFASYFLERMKADWPQNFKRAKEWYENEMKPDNRECVFGDGTKIFVSGKEK